jgi:transposase
VRKYCYLAFGVDVTGIPGIAVLTVQVLLTEVGPDRSKFRSGPAFASWLTLCPHNDISGGKVLRARTRKGTNRAALALRLAAQRLEHSETQPDHFFRRMRDKLGRPQAITAVAHKIAQIFYTLVTTGKSMMNRHWPKRTLGSGPGKKPNSAAKRANWDSN